MAPQQTESPQFTLTVPAGMAATKAEIELTTVAQVIAFHDDHAAFENGVPIDFVVGQLAEQGVPREQTTAEIERLKKRGEAYTPESDEGCIHSTATFAAVHADD